MAFRHATAQARSTIPHHVLKAVANLAQVMVPVGDPCFRRVELGELVLKLLHLGPAAPFLLPEGGKGLVEAVKIVLGLLVDDFLDCLDATTGIFQLPLKPLVLPRGSV